MTKAGGTTPLIPDADADRWADEIREAEDAQIVQFLLASLEYYQAWKKLH